MTETTSSSTPIIERLLAYKQVRPNPAQRGSPDEYGRLLGQQ